MQEQLQIYAYLFLSSSISTTWEPLVNIKDLQAPNLAGSHWQTPELDPLAVLHLYNCLPIHQSVHPKAGRNTQQFTLPGRVWYCIRISTIPAF